MGKPTVGDRIRIQREKKGISARELDRLAGLHEGHVAQIESGRVPRMSLRTAAALADALEVRIDWIATGAGPERRTTIQSG